MIEILQSEDDSMNSSKDRLWTAAFILDTVVNLLIYLIYYLLMVIITVVAKDNLQASLAEAGLASGIFILGTLVARLLAGRFVEEYGCKKMLYAGLGIYLITTVFYFYMPNLWVLYVVRLLNGIGYGVASTATSTIVAAIVPASRRGEGINYYGLSTSLAAAVGPFLGMLLINLTGFYFIISLCVFLIVLCLLGTMGIQFNERTLHNDAAEERHGMRISDYLEPLVAPIAIVGLFMGFCYSSVLSFMAAYAREINLVEAGTFFFVVYAVVITVTRPLLGIVFDRKGENFVLYPCYIALAIGLWLISTAQSSAALLWAGVFVGLGYGTFMSNGQAVCVKLVPLNRVGVATSTYFITLDLGLGVGPYMLGFVRPSLGFSGVYDVTAVVALGCFVLYYLLYGRHVGKPSQDMVQGETGNAVDHDAADVALCGKEQAQH